MENQTRMPGDDEPRSAVALTVVWMLTCMSTAVGVVMVLALRLLMLALPVAVGRVHPLGQMAGVLLFVALTTGLLCLLFTPLVLKVRRRKPPRVIVQSAILIGVSPMILLAILAVLS